MLKVIENSILPEKTRSVGLLDVFVRIAEVLRLFKKNPNIKYRRVVL